MEYRFDGKVISQRCRMPSKSTCGYPDRQFEVDSTICVHFTRIPTALQVASNGRAFRFPILEKKARIEIRFDPHRTNTLQLALPSHFTRRRFEYQMQGSFGRIVALATRRRVLVGSGETGLRN